MIELLRVMPVDVRARRRPLAVLVLWVWDAALGLGLGASFTSVAATAYARHPDGDSPLFAPGGLSLLDFLRHSASSRGPLLVAVLVAMLLARFGGLVPSAAAIAELSFATRERRPAPLREAVTHAISVFPSSAGVEIFAMAIELLLLCSGAVFGSAASSWTVPRYGEPRGDEAFVAIVLVSMLVATMVGVVADVARVAVVRDGDSALMAILKGREVFQRAPLRLVSSYCLRAGASWVPVLLGVLLTARLNEARPVVLLVVMLFHQLVVLVRSAIEASWYARAVRALELARAY